MTLREGRLWPSILGGWALASAMLLAVSWAAIAHLWFPDSDDAMRLLEVRDWLAGQSWWDVAQHRLNGGAFAMHWSRLVDLPLAAVIAPLDSLVGPDLATRIAMSAIPLLTLLATVALTAHITRRLAGVEAARFAVLLVPLSVPILFQMRPLRIDHHGWQTVCALAAVAALVAPPTRRSGLALGLALAALVSISLEGLPIAVAILGAAALAWSLNLDRRDQLIAAAASWFAGVLLLHLATRGPAIFAPACDAIAPGWIAALGVGCGGAILCATAAAASFRLRIAALVGAAAAAVLTLALVSPACLHGPFASLPPIVRTLWFDNVAEGLPLWRQTPTWGATIIALPLVGLLGGVVAWRQDADRWRSLLLVQAAALLLALLVARAGCTANALAVPGAAWLLLHLLRRARAIRPLIPRLLATVGTYALAAPGLVASALLGAASGPALAQSAVGDAMPRCATGHEVQALAQLPPATLFAPIDPTPEILATSRHRAIAGPYHRNAAALATVLTTFTGSPAAARPAVIASGADYVVGCPGSTETDLYRSVAPDGFWARLERGQRFSWLRPVAIAGSPVRAWRVLRPPHRPLPPSPARR